MTLLKRSLVLFLLNFFVAAASSESLRDAVKCGPPKLLPEWSNVTAAVGGRAILTCPLDTLNSCLVDFVSIKKLTVALGFCLNCKKQGIVCSIVMPLCRKIH